VDKKTAGFLNAVSREDRKEFCMKKSMLLLTACIAVAVMSGCATTGVARVDAGTQIDLSGYWNDTDVRKVCESLIAQCLESPAVARRADEWRAGHGGENPTVIVGVFRNSSSEKIDTTIISKTMQTAIINSGVLDFVAGGDTRDQLRTERDDQQYNASEATAAALANETAATFMLTGTVNSMVDKAGNTSVRSYFVDAQLTNIETNRILWQAQNSDIKKVINQAKTKL
jgi:uncharacterized protein (TIGR02722 family)